MIQERGEALGQPVSQPQEVSASWHVAFLERHRHLETVIAKPIEADRHLTPQSLFFAGGLPLSLSRYSSFTSTLYDRQLR
jgi:hypothetical protein